MCNDAGAHRLKARTSQHSSTGLKEVTTRSISGPADSTKTVYVAVNLGFLRTSPQREGEGGAWILIKTHRGTFLCGLVKGSNGSTHRVTEGEVLWVLACPFNQKSRPNDVQLSTIPLG